MGSLDQAFSAEACSHPDSQLSLFPKEDGGGWDPALLKTGQDIFSQLLLKWG